MFFVSEREKKMYGTVVELWINEEAFAAKNHKPRYTPTYIEWEKIFQIYDKKSRKFFDRKGVGKHTWGVTQKSLVEREVEKSRISSQVSMRVQSFGDFLESGGTLRLQITSPSTTLWDI